MTPKWNIHKPQYDSKGQKLDAMARKYPAPDDQLTVPEMLALPPLKGTFRYDSEKDDEADMKRRERIEEEKRKRAKEDLEEAKRSLRGFQIATSRSS